MAAWNEKNVGYNLGNSRSWTNCAQHVDDNKDTIEDNVRFYLLWEHSWRWIQGEAIVKIVREKNQFLDFTYENSQSQTCKECKKKRFRF